MTHVIVGAFSCESSVIDMYIYNTAASSPHDFENTKCRSCISLAITANWRYYTFTCPSAARSAILYHKNKLMYYLLALMVILEIVITISSIIIEANNEIYYRPTDATRSYYTPPKKNVISAERKSRSSTWGVYVIGWTYIYPNRSTKPRDRIEAFDRVIAAKKVADRRSISTPRQLQARARALIKVSDEIFREDIRNSYMACKILITSIKTSLSTSYEFFFFENSLLVYIKYSLLDFFSLIINKCSTFWNNSTILKIVNFVFPAHPLQALQIAITPLEI